jgi:hypothetical protein
MYGGNPYEDDLEPDGIGSHLRTGTEHPPSESPLH